MCVVSGSRVGFESASRRAWLDRGSSLGFTSQLLRRHRGVGLRYICYNNIDVRTVDLGIGWNWRDR